MIQSTGRLCLRNTCIPAVHNQERATSMYSCLEIFTDQYSFRTILARFWNIFQVPQTSQQNYTFSWISFLTFSTLNTLLEGVYLPFSVERCPKVYLKNKPSCNIGLVSKLHASGYRILVNTLLCINAVHHTFWYYTVFLLSLVCRSRTWISLKAFHSW